MSFVPPPNTQYQSYTDPSNPYGADPSQQQQPYGGSTASSDHYYQQQQQAGAGAGQQQQQAPWGQTGAYDGQAQPPGFVPSRASTPTFTDSQHGGGGGGGNGAGFRASEPYVRSLALSALFSCGRDGRGGGWLGRVKARRQAG